MRAHALWGTVAASGLVALFAGACAPADMAVPAPSGVPANRAGALAVTRAHVANAFPPDTVLALASFFDPPGPAPESVPAVGNCDFNTPTPSPTSTASTIPWRDAGASVTLTSGATQITLDRFVETDGSILYISNSGDPSAIGPTAAFDLDFPGGSGANALPAASIASAVVLPPGLAITSPDFSAGDVPLGGASVPIVWDGSSITEPVRITLFITGSAGTATLYCTAPDTGSFELTASQISAFPSGIGTLTVARHASTTSQLSTSTVLVGDGLWIEGGTVTIP